MHARNNDSDVSVHADENVKLRSVRVREIWESEGRKKLRHSEPGSQCNLFLNLALVILILLGCARGVLFLMSARYHVPHTCIFRISKRRK